MKEILERIAAIAPAYIHDLLALIAGPKTYVLQKVHDEPDNLKSPLIFLAASLALSLILQISALGHGQDIWIFMAPRLVATVILCVMTAAAIWISWRLLGGKAPLTAYVVIYFYYAAVFALSSGLFNAVSMGMMKTVDPRLVTWVMENNQEAIERSGLGHSGLFIAAMLVMVAYFFLASLWVIAGWGAYRLINESTKLKSVAAFFIVGLLGWILMPIGYFVQRSFN